MLQFIDTVFWNFMEDFEEKKQVLSENLEEKVSKIWSEMDADVKNMYENSASSFLVGKAKGVITRYYGTNLNSVCATPPPPPPQYFMLPQLQSTCHYLVNHYVEIWHVRLGVQIICTH